MDRKVRIVAIALLVLLSQAVVNAGPIEEIALKLEEYAEKAQESGVEKGDSYWARFASDVMTPYLDLKEKDGALTLSQLLSKCLRFPAQSKELLIQYRQYRSEKAEALPNQVPPPQTDLEILSTALIRFPDRLSILKPNSMEEESYWDDFQTEIIDPVKLKKIKLEDLIQATGPYSAKAKKLLFGYKNYFAERNRRVDFFNFWQQSIQPFFIRFKSYYLDFVNRNFVNQVVQHELVAEPEVRYEEVILNDSDPENQKITFKRPYYVVLTGDSDPTRSKKKYYFHPESDVKKLAIYLGFPYYLSHEIAKTGGFGSRISTIAYFSTGRHGHLQKVKSSEYIDEIKMKVASVEDLKILLSK